MAGHVVGLFDAHHVQDGRRHISEDTVLLLDVPAGRSIRHDEWNLVGRVGRLRASIFVEHLFRISDGINLPSARWLSDRPQKKKSRTILTRDRR